MRVEIIAVGSEILLGQITNTNATFISQQLAQIGANVYYHTVVGDNPNRLKDAIEIAEKRADVVLLTGGLGPTKDDMTKETIANHLGINLIMNEEALSSIEAYFKRAKRTMTENNKKQALVFESSTVLVNRTGMAPGMAVEINGIHYLLLPGPPHEMEPMLVDEAIPYLHAKSGVKEIITSKVLKFYGVGEAELEHLVQPILERQTNPTIAPLATADGVTLRMTAKAETIEKANKLIEPVEAEIRETVGQFIYGTDHDTLSSRAVALLKEQQATIAAAESLTAGTFMGELGREPGVSATLLGGMVVYNERAKIDQLGVSEQLLDTHGIVSSECAASLAMKVREKFGATYGVGITGAAGPTPHDGEKAGTVWIGIAKEEEEAITYQLQLSGARNANRDRSVKFALYYLIQQLEGQ